MDAHEKFDHDQRRYRHELPFAKIVDRCHSTCTGNAGTDIDANAAIGIAITPRSDCRVGPAKSIFNIHATQIAVMGKAGLAHSPPKPSLKMSVLLPGRLLFVPARCGVMAHRKQWLNSYLDIVRLNNAEVSQTSHAAS